VFYGERLGRGREVVEDGPKRILTCKGIAQVGRGVEEGFAV
jgi:hypothetical protein